jgi:hypothetical protein
VFRYLSGKMTAVEVFESVTNGGASDFAQVVEILNDCGPWCLIGGLAVNCYADPVYTVDADVVVVLANLGAIRDRLIRAGFYVSTFAHSLNARKGSSKLSVQFTSDERYQPFIERAQRQDILGQRIPVAKLEDVIQGKVWAWQDATRRLSKRKKDELDLIRIGEAHPGARGHLPQEIAKLLSED